ncbi:MAG: threonine/serine exporter family protein [Clostridia bacterium]|nr:threonine/serine exporter family protein [Clostridia bacterium]
MVEFIIAIISSFVATLGFTLIYNIKGKNLIIASVSGAFSWAVYLICQRYSASLVFPYLMSGVAIALYSELAAYFFRVPATVYLKPGIIPLVPGLTVFRTMESCLFGDIGTFAEGLVTTIKIGGAIALGLIFMSSFIRLMRSGVALAKSGIKHG